MTVLFTSVKDIREFVSIASLQPYGVELFDGCNSANAKDFMEIFAVDFTRPLGVRVDSPEQEALFADAAERFLR